MHNKNKRKFGIVNNVVDIKRNGDYKSPNVYQFNEKELESFMFLLLSSQGSDSYFKQA